MKRYDLENYEDSLSIMNECSDGEWVDYDEVQSHLSLLAAVVLEAHKISPECEYCVRSDAPSCSVEQCEKIGCQCPACKVAREVMG